MAGRQQTVIGNRYELQRVPIAKGGMGEVWEGRDLKLDREIAVKFIRFPDDKPDDNLVRRFVRESRITARLQHPGVPAVFDVGTHESRPFLVMQRIRGVSVADLVAEQGPLPIGWAAAIAAQTCSVLAVAHRESLVHRDLKPSNLMLEADGTVKVLDFGLAVAVDLADFSQITRSGETLGTPAYMAPEQVLSTISTPQSDLYALGCVLYEMLVGKALFAGSTAYAVMNKQVAERPASVKRSRKDVPDELDRLIADLLAKKPEDRPPSAEAVYERLLPFVTDLNVLPGALQPPTRPSPVRMYAGIVSRVLTAPEPAKPADAPRAAAPDTNKLRAELANARAAAESFIHASRYREAADRLAPFVGPASRALGKADTDVVAVRVEFADALFDSGDYRAAAPAYRQVVDDLGGSGNSETVRHCRLREATCLALTGQTTRALRQLGALLDDVVQRYGANDPETFELRQQIGLLQLGAGQQNAAKATLADLHADLVRAYGEMHNDARQIGQLVSSLP